MQIPEMIPEPRRDGVRAALRAAFGVDTAHGFQPIRGGVSGALISRFEAFERSYVLRIEPERVAQHDRERGYACMVAAANAGVAPLVHFCDPTTGIAIMDFVAARPLSQHPGGVAGVVRSLGVLIAKMQTTPPFPATLGYSKVIGSLLAHLNTSCFFLPGQLRSHIE